MFPSHKTLSAEELSFNAARDAQAKRLAKTRVTFGRARRSGNGTRVDVRIDGQEVGFLCTNRHDPSWYACVGLADLTGSFDPGSLADLKAELRRRHDGPDA